MKKQRRILAVVVLALLLVVAGVVIYQSNQFTVTGTYRNRTVTSLRLDLNEDHSFVFTEAWGDNSGERYWGTYKVGRNEIVCTVTAGGWYNNLNKAQQDTAKSVSKTWIFTFSNSDIRDHELVEMKAPSEYYGLGFGRYVY